MSGDRLRIVHAYKIFRPDIEGGIPAVIASLAASPPEGGHHSVLCARRRGFGHDYTIDGVPVEAVSSLGTLFSTPMAPTYIPTLISRARSADVVIHHAPLPLNDAALLLGLPDDVGLIIYWHAEIVGFALLKRLVTPLIRRVLKRADRIVVSGPSMIEASPFLAPHADKCVVVPYGTDVTYWRTLDESDGAAAEKIRRDKPRHIVSLGRLVLYKGYDVLIRAMATIDGHASIIGEGPLLPELQALAQELGVADRVHLPGQLPRAEIRRLFHAASVFAFPSVTEAEAFGIVQIEAMAAGLPIVNTSLGTTVPLVARHDREALTVPPRDVPALAQALNRLLDDPVLASRLGTGGRSRAEAEYDSAVCRSRMATICDEVRQARARRRPEA
jgi:glycosyltransferase involved in cell wall biosynthesis